jgi:plasmid stability protein
VRTTVDLPEALVRKLKARAALEGTSLKSLVREAVERGLRAAAEPVREKTGDQVLPSIRLGRALNLAKPSNATLFEFLDE